MNNCLISIIIPVYNAEKYLCKCIDSVIAQTYTNWECILVDDGSEDSSGNICDEYVTKDSRFKVIHEKNGGVSTARNAGIEVANGDWIYFCDADDSLPAEGLEIMVAKTFGDVEFIMAGYQTYDENGNLRTCEINSKDRALTRDDALLEMYSPTDYYYQGYLWCKLMKLSIVRKFNMEFDTHIYFNEDRLFVTEYISHIEKRIVYTTKSVYNYVRRTDGVMGSLEKGYNKKYATDFDAYVKMKEIIDGCTNNNQLKRVAIVGIVSSYIMNHRFMVKFKEYDAGIHKHMLKCMMRTGAFSYHLKQLLRDFMLLTCPKFVVKHQNKYYGKN